MPHYDFRKDLKIANKTEKEIADYFVSKGFELIEMRNDNKYDIKLKAPKGQVITIEVKEDFTCERTGNIGVEYSCRGRDSGINVCQADFYIYKAHTPRDGIEYLMMETEKLKKIIELKWYHRTINGGDPGSDSLNYLFYLEDIRDISDKLNINP